MVHLIVIEKDEARDVVLDALKRKGFDVVIQSTGENGAEAPDAPRECPEICTVQKILEVLEKRFQDEHRDEGFYRFVMRTIEKPMIEKALRRTGGNQLAAARMLGINRNTIRSKIRRLGIRRPGIAWDADGDDRPRSGV